MARFIPPEVRKKILQNDTIALSRMARNGNRVKLAKKKRRMAKLERGAIIFARGTPTRE